MKTKTCTHPTCDGPCRRPPTQKKARTPIRPVSKNEAKRRRKYSVHKRKLFADDNICAVALLENKSKEVIELFKECQYNATEFHHPAGRIGDKLFTDKGVKLCGNCHRIVEVKPYLTKQLGLSVSRLSI